MTAIQAVQAKCPECGSDAAVKDILARATVSWPNQGWLLFTCAQCNGAVHVGVSDGRIEVGELDGGPGPCLMVTQTVAVPGLKVKVTESGIAVTLRGLRRRVPARR